MSNKNKFQNYQQPSNWQPQMSYSNSNGRGTKPYPSDYQHQYYPPAPVSGQQQKQRYSPTYPVASLEFLSQTYTWMQENGYQALTLKDISYILGSQYQNSGYLSHAVNPPGSYTPQLLNQSAVSSFPSQQSSCFPHNGQSAQSNWQMNAPSPPQNGYQYPQKFSHYQIPVQTNWQMGNQRVNYSDGQNNMVQQKAYYQTQPPPQILSHYQVQQYAPSDYQSESGDVKHIMINEVWIPTVNRTKEDVQLQLVGIISRENRKINKSSETVKDCEKYLNMLITGELEVTPPAEKMLNENVTINVFEPVLQTEQVKTENPAPESKIEGVAPKTDSKVDVPLALPESETTQLAVEEISHEEQHVVGLTPESLLAVLPVAVPADTSDVAPIVQTDVPESEIVSEIMSESASKEYVYVVPEIASEPTFYNDTDIPLPASDKIAHDSEVSTKDDLIVAGQASNLAAEVPKTQANRNQPQNNRKTAQSNKKSQPQQSNKKQQKQKQSKQPKPQKGKRADEKKVGVSVDVVAVGNELEKLDNVKECIESVSGKDQLSSPFSEQDPPQVASEAEVVAAAVTGTHAGSEANIEADANAVANAETGVEAEADAVPEVDAAAGAETDAKAEAVPNDAAEILANLQNDEAPEIQPAKLSKSQLKKQKKRLRKLAEANLPVPTENEQKQNDEDDLDRVLKQQIKVCLMYYLESQDFLRQEKQLQDVLSDTEDVIRTIVEKVNENTETITNTQTENYMTELMQKCRDNKNQRLFLVLQVEQLIKDMYSQCLTEDYTFFGNAECFPAYHNAVVNYMDIFVRNTIRKYQKHQILRRNPEYQTEAKMPKIEREIMEAARASTMTDLPPYNSTPFFLNRYRTYGAKAGSSFDAAHQAQLFDILWNFHKESKGGILDFDFWYLSQLQDKKKEIRYLQIFTVLKFGIEF